MKISWWVFVVFAVVLVGGGVVFLRVRFLKRSSSVPVAPVVVDTTPMARRWLDGIFIPTTTASADLLPFGVMVENSADARPLSGISKAHLVWEASAEAGITRLFAVFLSGDDVEEIGPVRSLRPYYLDFAEELGTLVAHVGGSPEALKEVDARGCAVLDLNEFFNGKYFWRSTDRSAPHNVYTSTALLRHAHDAHRCAASPSRGYVTNSLESWQYKEDAPLEARKAGEEVTIDFSSPLYKVTWKYNAATNEYVRFLYDELYHDKNGDEVRAKNVAVMITEMKILDDVGRREFRTHGKGKAIVFYDGVAHNGIWERGPERTGFSFEGNTTMFNAGVTWIEVVGNARQVIYGGSASG